MTDAGVGAASASTHILAVWVLVCTLAEVFGIGAAVVWYGAVMSIFGEPADLLPRVGVWFMATLAAVPEGFVLGGVQGWWLSRIWPQLSVHRWIFATVAVGVVGWAIGAFIPLFVFPDGGSVTQSGGPPFDPPLAATAAFAAVFGLTVGAVFGLGQSLALPFDWNARVYWIFANALGWMVALPLIYVAAQVASDIPGWGPRLALWMLGGAGAGLAIGLSTTIAIRHMSRLA